jgi:anti-sigma B factor antagonist
MRDPARARGLEAKKCRTRKEGTVESIAHKGPSQQNPVTFAISQLTPEAGTTVLAVEGELDLATAPRLEGPLTEVAGEHHDRVVIDLSGLTFIDSTALRLLVDANRLRSPENPLVVVCSNPKVLRIFKISGLGASFQMVSSLGEALSGVAAKRLDPVAETEEGLQRI